MKPLSFVLFALAAAGCGRAGSAAATASSTIALASDDRTLWVANPDADSVTVIDPATRAVLAEIALGPTPAVDGNGRY
jgi:YVTN family beta-propeller protein